MDKFLLQRNYKTGWYTLARTDAIDGVKSYLQERKGVKNICIGSCTPAQLEGDKGYEVHVSYQEDLDETFGFPEKLDKVIFLDIDSDILPYYVGKVAYETHAGIVITNPSLKDKFYDVGNLFPVRLAKLIDNANNRGVKIVGITSSISRMQDYGFSFSEMMERSISDYLDDHPSIEKFIIVNREDIPNFFANVFIGEDISFGDDEKAIDMLNKQAIVKKRKYNDWSKYL